MGNFFIADGLLIYWAVEIAVAISFLFSARSTNKQHIFRTSSVYKNLYAVGYNVKLDEYTDIKKIFIEYAGPILCANDLNLVLNI